MGPTLTDDRSEIAFFDVETTVPSRSGQGFAILEFGAILVCPRRLEELQHYSTLIRPADLSLISSLSVRCNGITRDAVISAPTFENVAEKVYDILHGRIWAGHNILRFDCPRIREAFAEIGRFPPEPKGTIDSLALLTQRFGRRAGDMKMATLATYFGIGKQTHRSLDDVRMNLEVLKYCATVLFLESSLPEIFTENSWVSPPTTRSRKTIKEGTSLNMRTPPSSSTEVDNIQNVSLTDHEKKENHPILSLLTCCTKQDISNFVSSGSAKTDTFDMSQLCNEMKTSILQPDVTMEEKCEPVPGEMSCKATVTEGCSGYAGFFEPDEVSIPNLSASLAPFYCGSQRIKVLHRDAPLQLCCSRLNVRFGISTKFVDHAGRTRLNIVVDISPSLCKVLDACDGLAQKLSIDSGSGSEWRPAVTRKNGFFNCPTARLHIPTVVIGDIAQYATEIYQKDSYGITQKLIFSKFDAAEIEPLLIPGTLVDTFFSLEPYDYQQSAGIRLVAKKLVIIHNE